jgi:plastocyanin
MLIYRLQVGLTMNTIIWVTVFVASAFVLLTNFQADLVEGQGSPSYGNGSGGLNSSQPSASSLVVTIAPGSSSLENEKFYDPANLTVTSGSTVTWRNDDADLHTVTSGTARGGQSGTVFDSGHLAAGEKFQWTFSKAGTFDYYCTLHPYMSGKIIVQ